jgi:hypothetical protein
MENTSIPDRFFFPQKKQAHDTISTGMNRINSYIGIFLP